MGLAARLAELRDRANRRRGPVLVHRVDGVPQLTRGVVTPACRNLTRGVVTPADHIQPAVDALTGHSVFQTDFCRTSFATRSGCLPASWCVINNPVDPDISYPGSAKHHCPDKELRLVATSWSPSPGEGFAALAANSRLPGVQSTFAGNWCPDVDPAVVATFPEVIERGVPDG